MFGLGVIFTASPDFLASANSTTTTANEFVIQAYGDSIAYGETPTEDRVTSYPEIFEEKYNSTFNNDFVLNAVSGHTTTDLLEILEPYKDGTASDEDMSKFEDTDIVTLCIGANNILGSALANISNFLTGAITTDQYQALLDAGVATFKAEYPQILQSFDGKKIVVMTIYNPFKYLSLSDVQISSSLASHPLASMLPSLLTTYDAKLQTMLAMSMNSLNNEINATIRASASQNVYVVDIWDLFEGYTQEEYKEYIFCDASKVVISSIDIAAEMSQFTTACDPHPTAEGQKVIAEAHLEGFKYHRLSTDGDFSSLKDSTDKITLDIDTAQTDSFTYKLYKTDRAGKSFICQTTEKTINVSASDIAGTGKLYVEVYDGTNLVFTTNSLEYNVSLNTFTLSSSATLSGVKDSTDKATLSVECSNTIGNDYTYIFYKNVGQEIELGKNTTGTLEIGINRIVGEGELYVKVYNANNTLVYTTNSLDYSITLNSFALTSSKSLENLILDESEDITFTITAQNLSGYTFKLFKKSSSQPLAESGTSEIKVASDKLLGEGEVYVDVYKNSSKIKTTNTLAYSVKMNTFSIEAEQLSGIVSSSKEIVIKVTPLQDGDYIYKLFKSQDSTPTLIKQSSSKVVTTYASNLEGEGEIYIEVYKNSKLIYTTDSLNYNITIGVFQLTSDNKPVLTEDQMIELTVNSSAVPNVEYRLVRSNAQGVLVLQRNSTGKFSVQAKEVEGITSLYVEVYSAGKFVSKTNTITLDLDFTKTQNAKAESAFDNIMLIAALVIISIISIGGGVIVIARMRKRNSF